jgi:hypothetical protein
MFYDAQVQMSYAIFDKSLVKMYELTYHTLILTTIHRPLHFYQSIFAVKKNFES